MSNSRNKKIEKIPNTVIHAASIGKLVIFIGAGISKIIGCPSWQEFALKQWEELYKNEAIDYYEFKQLESLPPRKLLSICKKIFKEKKIEFPNAKLIKAKDDQYKKFNKIYEDIYSLNGIYVTTNYDEYLDQIAEQPLIPTNSIATELSSKLEVKNLLKPKIVYEENEILISKLDNGNIIHIHGSVKDGKTMVITMSDYMKTYARDSKVSAFLEEVFKNFTVLFIGYGIEEYEIMEFLVTATHSAKNEIKHFMLYSMYQNEANLLKFYEKYYTDLGIQLIPYSINERGHEQLVDIIHEWAKVIGPIARPRNFLEKIKLIDEVVK